jgi:hypothetical protein
LGRRVAIVGFADSYALAPFDEAVVEIWGINELHRYLPRWDRWFELHSREAFEVKGSRDQEAHVNWLRAQCRSVRRAQADLHARAVRRHPGG